MASYRVYYDAKSSGETFSESQDFDAKNDADAHEKAKALTERLQRDGHLSGRGYSLKKLHIRSGRAVEHRLN